MNWFNKIVCFINQIHGLCLNFDLIRLVDMFFLALYQEINSIINNSANEQAKK